MTAQKPVVLFGSGRFARTIHYFLVHDSPYDVVAWHGNYVPYVYDLAMFAPVSNVRVDHPESHVYS